MCVRIEDSVSAGVHLSYTKWVFSSSSRFRRTESTYDGSVAIYRFLLLVYRHHLKCSWSHHVYINIHIPLRFKELFVSDIYEDVPMTHSDRCNCLISFSKSTARRSCYWHRWTWWRSSALNWDRLWKSTTPFWCLKQQRRLPVMNSDLVMSAERKGFSWTFAAYETFTSC